MAKSIKITKPSECPHRDCISGKYFCDHTSMKLCYCTWIDKFPDGCPLLKEENKE
jgi:hypothetical protein